MDSLEEQIFVGSKKIEPFMLLYMLSLSRESGYWLNWARMRCKREHNNGFTALARYLLK
jgi:hypothetical protein